MEIIKQKNTRTHAWFAGTTWKTTLVHQEQIEWTVAETT